MLPLQVPGGLELLVIALVFLVPLALLVAAVAAVVYFLRRSGGDGADPDRVAALESRVDELEAELRDRN
ncbi:hypothetical protein [Haloglomus litoreum]|uniref:hypothetical protein n=1 Tax=Haloglomus litoreum TaxID=3034026 RepID=UPI0023E8157B|nr:hypothetical protein [Haloglomus sp. DT116]